ncbi:hypothetical protein GJ496_010621 [Pomphorhynchus laevis]|nr:hypothetical protein GJ496_010621 [Pomphorhynchus laevis]
MSWKLSSSRRVNSKVVSIPIIKLRDHVGSFLKSTSSETLSTAYYIQFSTTSLGDLNIVNAQFLISEISAVLGRLAAHKAAGLDGLTRDHLKGMFIFSARFWIKVCLQFSTH